MTATPEAMLGAILLKMLNRGVHRCRRQARERLAVRAEEVGDGEDDGGQLEAPDVPHDVEHVLRWAVAADEAERRGRIVAGEENASCKIRVGPAAWSR